jgi:hypothetical protein
MNRPIRHGKDPFGRSFSLCSETMRRKHRIEEANRENPYPHRRKSVPLTCMKVK